MSERKFGIQKKATLQLLGKQKKLTAEGKRTRRLPRWQRVIRILIVMILLMAGTGYAIIRFWPEVAARNIDKLRDIIGDDAVAQLESAVLSVQDHSEQLQYQVGLAQPAAPWASSTPDITTTQPEVGQVPAAVPSASPTEISTAEATIAQTSPTIPPIASSTSVESVNQPPQPSATLLPPTRIPATLSGVSAGVPTAIPSPSLTPPTAIAAVATAGTAPTWQLTPLQPFGTLAGEGQWSAYMKTANGRTTLAYRTFLQPDPQRPYSIAAVVAFDVQTTRLHYVLGTVDPIPYVPQPFRTGTIAAADLRPGVLIATFNGGFKARHGHFGAMADGLIALPPLDGIATVAIHSDGKLQIGEWGTDITSSADLVAWRQNSYMLIHDGKINPETVQKNMTWGSTIHGSTITWRSAIGTSANGRTLYYVAGPTLDVPTLAKVLAQAGANEAMELDVNNTWVEFAAIRSSGATLIAEPLLTSMKESDRYLKTSDRDFFYVTAYDSTPKAP